LAPNIDFWRKLTFTFEPGLGREAADRAGRRGDGFGAVDPLGPDDPVGPGDELTVVVDLGLDPPHDESARTTSTRVARIRMSPIVFTRRGPILSHDTSRSPIN